MRILYDLTLDARGFHLQQLAHGVQLRHQPVDFMHRRARNALKQ
jgi:hypothetical protein